MSADYRRLISCSVGILLTLTWAMPAASDNHNKGTLTFAGVRSIPHEATMNPDPLVLVGSEKMQSTVRLQVRFIQETECRIAPNLTDIMQNVADTIAASGAAQALQGRFAADIDKASEFKATLYDGDVSLRDCARGTNLAPDPDYDKTKKAAVKRLEAAGFKEMAPIDQKFGGITITVTPWVRKIGSSGTELGEIRGRVSIKLDADIDKENLRFRGGFHMVGEPEFESRNPPPRGPDRRKAQEQYEAFKVRFNEAVSTLLAKLNVESNLFKSVKDADDFVFLSDIGNTVTREKRRSIPFMGERQPLHVKIVLTAGPWARRYSGDGAGQEPTPYRDFEDADEDDDGN